ncbi:hypothetical protein BGZ95_002841 [Linnemannia exigua]|uniref:Protein SQS1 n=1 Tax=Linnemannia exigua TaxID=604196 RepID=A0AAD4DIK3_9FUNG|nr:hypothetical protein BGZ95_002841 [Linnemannia exigua]
MAKRGGHQGSRGGRGAHSGKQHSRNDRGRGHGGGGGRGRGRGGRGGGGGGGSRGGSRSPHRHSYESQNRHSYDSQPQDGYISLSVGGRAERRSHRPQQQQQYKHKRRSESGSGQGEVYRQIQLSKAPQRGGRSNQGGSNGRDRSQSRPGSGSRGRGGDRGRRGPTTVTFNRATRLTNPDYFTDDDIEGAEDGDDDDGVLDDYRNGMSGSGDDDSTDYDDEFGDGGAGNPEEGLDSDEIDESEDQFIMQRFDWEEDQDPDRQRKLARARAAAEAAAAAARAAEPFIPPAGWGGALAYQSGRVAQGGDESSGDESSEDEYEDAREIVRKALAAKSAGATGTVQEAVVHHERKAFEEADQINGSSKTTTTMTAQSTKSHVSKKSKIIVDLTGVVEAKVTEQVQQPFFIDLTTTEETTVIAAETGAASAGAEAESQPDLEMLWVIDTEPSAITLEEEPQPQIQETYINLPPEPEFTGRPTKKTHRSKRGGKKLREEEQERKRIKAMSETGDGHIALDEAESEEVDDDMLALEDYLQNTTDVDNPDYFDSFLGSFASLPSGFGHSNDVHGGLDPDDSDFEEDGSEDDSQDDEDFDFTSKSSNRRRKRKADQLLSGALDAAFDSNWPAGAPHGYDFYEPEEFVGRNGRRSRGGVFPAAVPYGNHLEALTSINDHIKEFVNDRSKVSLELPPLAKALRRRVHLLSEQYNLRSQSVGAGKNRLPVLMRTEKTKIPQTPIDIRRFMSAGLGGPRVQAEFDTRRDRSNGKRGASNNRRDSRRGGRSGDRGNDTNGGGSKDPRDSARAVTGSVVGGTASEISKENVGHRMLAKMGWSPGVGLGASGGGITKPIEAVVRAKRRGLGHE